MLTFIEETLKSIRESDQNLLDATFILPSKRAGGFLKNYIRKSATKAQFLPKIISIEELIEELSGLEIIDTTELLFRSYDVYQKTSAFKEKDTFDDFSAWAITLLNDFNEVDRFLIDTNQFFKYLGSIKAMERWNVTNQNTTFIETYVAFWNSLPHFYENLKSSMLSDGIAYQGLVYREAVDAVEHYLQANTDQTHYFVGFNALNTAEQQIIQAFLESGTANVYWDVERSLVEDTAHSASLFFRRYLKNWKYLQQHKPKFISNNFELPKEINIVECQKNMAQVKYVGQLLKSFSEEKLNQTAVVLADELLLTPLLHSLPNNVSNVNVTMGATIKNFPATIFFETLLGIHVKNPIRLYYKDVLAVLGHPMTAKLIDTRHLSTVLLKGNQSHFLPSELIAKARPKDQHQVSLLFDSVHDNPSKVLEVFQVLVQKLKSASERQSIETVILYELHGIFSKLQSLDAKFEHLATLGSLQNLFLELIGTTTIDFKGDAYDGLQIMGVLETRVLDFENIIVLSVNEGMFPAGKSNASFITYDLKKQFELPLFTEKDAIYTYHFYHMLHRAKEITLCYTNFSDGLNSGEKSRFLLQLEIAPKEQHTINHIQVVPRVSVPNNTIQEVAKTESVMARLAEISAKGFSPSALTSYIRNPLDFYYQKILKIKEEDGVEETVAYNTLGTIVHNALQHLYTPFLGESLTKQHLLNMKKDVATQVALQFSEHFSGGDISKGKNLIIFEVAKRYVENAIRLDENNVEKGHKIELIHIEADLKLELSLPELNFPVHIHGQVDRVDRFDGILRIIDYKTGNVYSGDLEIIDWDEMRSDYKFSKAFQVLTYALMLHGNNPFNEAQGGIISFKNMNSGFMPFATKEHARGKKDRSITKEVIARFYEQLKALILEICNPDFPFVEKEID